MPFNNMKYRELLANGIPHGAAKILADSDNDTIDGGPVTPPAALTAPTTISGSFAQADHQKLRDDVASLRATVNALHTALKNAGVIQ
jgi:hypothetical protein